MGISEFREVKNNFIPKTSFSKLKDYTNHTTPVNVYIDGSFYTYTGFISQNLSSDGTYYIPNLVAQTVCNSIESSISKIRKLKFEIDNIYVFFDGVKSYSKQQTILKRRQKKQTCANMNKIVNTIIRNFNDLGYIINNLAIGEAEHEMFIYRNTSNPSIFLTDDSDMFHISYGYNSRTFNDYAFLGTKSLNFTCDLYKLKECNFKNMPKLVFTTLCGLKGCDYTYDTFTKSMYITAIKEFINPSNHDCLLIVEELKNFCKRFKKFEFLTISNIHSHLKPIIYNSLTEEKDYVTISGIYTINDVCFVIKLLLKLLICSSYKFQWNKTQHTFCKDDGILAQIQTLTWTVNYSLIGCRYNKYFENISYPQKLDIFTFYATLLSFKNDIVFDKSPRSVVSRKQFMDIFVKNVSTKQKTKNV